MPEVVNQRKGNGDIEAIKRLYTCAEKVTFVSIWCPSEMLKTSSNIYRKEEIFSFICLFSVLQVSSLVLCLVKSLHRKERVLYD